MSKKNLETLSKKVNYLQMFDTKILARQRKNCFVLKCCTQYNNINITENTILTKILEQNFFIDFQTLQKQRKYKTFSQPVIAHFNRVNVGVLQDGITNYLLDQLIRNEFQKIRKVMQINFL